MKETQAFTIQQPVTGRSGGSKIDAIAISPDGKKLAFLKERVIILYQLS
jgi:hypothetical protein